MKANNSQNLPPNKKLILHFDIDAVIRLPSRKNKDLYVYLQLLQVYDLCSEWVWGRLEKNSKEDPDKVTGWKLASNQLLKEAPEADLICYKKYLQDHVNPDADEWEKLILNLSKGPAAKAKAEIEKTIKNIVFLWFNKDNPEAFAWCPERNNRPCQQTWGRIHKIWEVLNPSSLLQALPFTEEK